MCNEVCAEEEEQDPWNCECIGTRAAQPPSSHLEFFPGTDMWPMNLAYPSAVPLFVPYAPTYDNPMNKLCYIKESCTIGFGFADGSGIFNDLDFESMGGSCQDVEVDGITQLKFAVHRQSQQRDGVHPVRRLIEIKAMDNYDQVIWGTPICESVRKTDMSHVSSQTDSIEANARFVGINYQ
jgi:hypothetical protein